MVLTPACRACAPTSTRTVLASGRPFGPVLIDILVDSSRNIELVQAMHDNVVASSVIQSCPS
jgi:hypothetical protein